MRKEEKGKTKMLLQERKAKNAHSIHVVDLIVGFWTDRQDTDALE
jgi:hypothetical protein